MRSTDDIHYYYFLLLLLLLLYICLSSLSRPLPRREAGGLLMSRFPPPPPPPLSCLESQGCQFNPTLYIPLLFFCLALSLFLSYPFLLLAHCPDLFCFPLNLFFPKGRLFCVALVFLFLFDRLGDEYFSWLYVHLLLAYSPVNRSGSPQRLVYVQLMLSYDAGISLYAFILFLI